MGPQEMFNNMLHPQMILSSPDATITTSGVATILTFTACGSTSTLTMVGRGTASVLIVGGGGGGGRIMEPNGGGAGGGNGGSVYESVITLPSGTFSISVGCGGIGFQSGDGGHTAIYQSSDGLDGVGLLGVTSSLGTYSIGGGAGNSYITGTPTTAYYSFISGTAGFYGGGGGRGIGGINVTGQLGATNSGQGGGGDAGTGYGQWGTNAVPNFGGGGGGGSSDYATWGGTNSGGSGASGIVIIRYTKVN